MKKKWLAGLLAGTMVISLAACGGSGSSSGGSSGGSTGGSDNGGGAAESVAEEVAAEEVNGDEYFGKSTEFTYMIANGLTTTDFTEYEDAPALQYAMSKEWDPDGNGNTRKVTLDVLTPPPGGESDYANRLVSTGDYPDVMNIQIMSMNATEMYEDGLTLDLTDYVMQYMPNYRAFFERHPEFAGRETSVVDGQRRYLCLYHLDEQAPQAWGGMLYRRDWIVKYGENPETGAAFSGEWDAEGNWVDDVVFPSGETFPKTVSDWEWMLGIFQKALDTLGITDGYAYSLASNGENGAGGDMESGFGAANTWYIDPESGEVVYGGTKDGFRAYLKMMNTWYENGWVNPTFEEHANDMFFLVDMGTVFSGKVGAWYGLTSSLGGGLDSKSGDEKDPLNGAVVFAAPTPINDVYGDASVQGFEPFLYYATGQFGAQLVVSEKAADKDLPALFTFLDYFYGLDDGSLVLTFGLNKEQTEELKTINPDAYALYEKWGIAENGSYTWSDEGKIVKDPAYHPDNSEVGGACNLVRFNGLTNEVDLDQGWLPYYAEQMALYRLYDTSKAGIGGEISAQLTPEQSSNFSDVFNNVKTYNDQTIPQFIKGEKDIDDDAQWQEYCETIDGYDVQSYCDDINGILNAG